MWPALAQNSSRRKDRGVPRLVRQFGWNCERIHLDDFGTIDIPGQLTGDLRYADHLQAVHAANLGRNVKYPDIDQAHGRQRYQVGYAVGLAERRGAAVGGRVEGQ